MIEYPRRKDFLGTHGLGDLLRRRCSPTPRPSFSLSPPFAASRLPLFFGADGKRFGKLPCGRGTDLTLQFVDPALQGHDQIDQPIRCDPPRTNILPELLDIHASF